MLLFQPTQSLARRGHLPGGRDSAQACIFFRPQLQPHGELLNASPVPSRGDAALRAENEVSSPSGLGMSFTSNTRLGAVQSCRWRCCSNCRSIGLGGRDVLPATFARNFRFFSRPAAVQDPDTIPTAPYFFFQRLETTICTSWKSCVLPAKNFVAQGMPSRVTTRPRLTWAVDAATLWRRYIQLTEAEWAFRITKDEFDPADLAPQRRPREGSHPGLLPGLCTVEDVGGLDARGRSKR